MHITFFSFITRMYIFIFGSVFTFFPNIYCAWSLNGISRHFIIISNLSTHLTPIPPLTPLLKKHPEKPKIYIFVTDFGFFFSTSILNNKNCIPLSVVFFFLITWLSFNYIYIFEICISIVTEEEIITFIKKIENGKI